MGDGPDSSGTSPLLEHLLQTLEEVTGSKFAEDAWKYQSFIAAAQTEVQNTLFADELSDLHDSLTDEFVFGKIRAIEAWANGESAFKVLPKSWSSVVDKLYRLNVEENESPGAPPKILSIREQAARLTKPTNSTWITVDRASDFADDLLRTKFVVPFVDGVMDVSSRITSAARERELPLFRRYHAKDSGYHAHHIYILMPVPDLSGGSTEISFEIKVLTKLQDTLGELTHLLYQLKRTGTIPAEKKRKLAWLIESPDFEASYIGHSAHYIEAALVKLKNQLEALQEGEPRHGES